MNWFGGVFELTAGDFRFTDENIPFADAQKVLEHWVSRNPGVKYYAMYYPHPTQMGV